MKDGGPEVGALPCASPLPARRETMANSMQDRKKTSGKRWTNSAELEMRVQAAEISFSF